MYCQAFISISLEAINDRDLIGYNYIIAQTIKSAQLKNYFGFTLFIY